MNNIIKILIAFAVLFFLIMAFFFLKPIAPSNKPKVVVVKPNISSDENSKTAKKNETVVAKKDHFDQWAEISKKIAIVEEEINSDNFASLDGLKELLISNPDYPRKKEVDAAIKNWEQEKVWSGISKQLVGLEKELNSGNFKKLEVVKDLMQQNPTYPMKFHIDESIQRWEQAIVWEELTKQAEMMEYMLDKGIYTELENLKKMMLKNPDYPRLKHFEKKIKKWDHEVFLMNVPL